MLRWCRVINIFQYSTLLDINKDYLQFDSALVYLAKLAISLGNYTGFADYEYSFKSLHIITYYYDNSKLNDLLLYGYAYIAYVFVME